MGARRPRGQVLLFTGDGKGKTSAAMGTVLRLAAAGRRVLVVQFAKRPGASGEQRALRKFAPKVVVQALGKAGWLKALDGSRRKAGCEEIVREWARAMKLARSRQWDAVVFDELNFVVSAGFLNARTVTDFLDARPGDMTVILTGRGKVRAILQRADTVTEMRNIKHPFDAGHPAVRGIDF